MAMKNDLWEEELSDEDRKKLIDKITHEVTKRKLEVPTIMILELHKPVGNILAHFAVGAVGFIAPVIGAELFNDLTRLLTKREHIEELIVAIEDRATSKG